MSFDTGLGEYYVHPDDYQVCFESDTPFLDRNGDTTNLGLLPECETDYESFVYVPPVPPCVEDRNVDGSFVSPDVPGAGRRPEGPRLTA